MTGNWNLVGHEWAVDMLKKHVSHGTTRHAYLFTGPPGLGRRTLALRFAQALNCQTPVEAGMHLIRMPKRPEKAPAIRITVGLKTAPEGWRDYFYWNMELDES